MRDTHQHLQTKCQNIVEPQVTVEERNQRRLSFRLDKCASGIFIFPEFVVTLDGELCVNAKK
jgi:hypothetical protein